MTARLPIPALPDTAEGLEHYYGDAPEGVRANMIMTADGAAAFAGRTKKITDPIDQLLLQQLRVHADVVLVGAGTIRAERYGPIRLDQDQEAQRVAGGHVGCPPLAIVTAHAEFGRDAKIFDPSAPRPIIVTVERAASAAHALDDLADIVIAGEDRVDVGQMLDALRDRGLRRVLCEGGPYLLSALVEQDLVDDMCLTVSPYLAGSQPLTAEPPSERELPTRLRLRHVLENHDLLYLRYSR